MVVVTAMQSLKRAYTGRPAEGRIRQRGSRTSSACRDKVVDGWRGRIGREVEIFEGGGYRFRDAPVVDPAVPTNRIGTVVDRSAVCRYVCGE